MAWFFSISLIPISPVNHALDDGSFTFLVREGDRIAQLIIERIATPEVFEVEDLDATFRGAGGFGSTGI